MRARLYCVLVLAVLSAAISRPAYAQFKEKAFSQQYNDDKTPQKDSIDKLFTFRDYFGGLSHKKEVKIGVMFSGSLVFIGGSQIYNKQYWKLPIVYSAILGTAGAGIGLSVTGRKEAAKYCFIGTGVAYWGTLLDGVISYKPDNYPHPGKATLYSLLFPGAGQIYNKEFWKVPIYVGGFAAAFHFFETNRVNYERFRRIYREATDDPASYSGPISADVALYYRDVYRRYRDYSVLAMAAVYLLQIIDANVFSYMHDFNVSDDIALNITPSVIGVDTQYAFSPVTTSGVGLTLGLRF